MAPGVVHVLCKATKLPHGSSRSANERQDEVMAALASPPLLAALVAALADPSTQTHALRTLVRMLHHQQQHSGSGSGAAATGALSSLQGLQQALLQLGILPRLAPLVGSHSSSVALQCQLAMDLLGLLASHPNCLQQQHQLQLQAPAGAAANGLYPCVPAPSESAVAAAAAGLPCSSDAVLGIPVGAWPQQQAATLVVGSTGVAAAALQPLPMQLPPPPRLEACVPGLLADLHRLLLQPAQASSMVQQVLHVVDLLAAQGGQQVAELMVKQGWVAALWGFLPHARLLLTYGLGTASPFSAHYDVGGLAAVTPGSSAAARAGDAPGSGASSSAGSTTGSSGGGSSGGGTRPGAGAPLLHWEQAPEQQHSEHALGALSHICGCEEGVQQLLDLQRAYPAALAAAQLAAASAASRVASTAQHARPASAPGSLPRTSSSASLLSRLVGVGRSSKQAPTGSPRVGSPLLGGSPVLGSSLGAAGGGMGTHLAAAWAPSSLSSGGASGGGATAAQPSGCTSAPQTQPSAQGEPQSVVETLVGVVGEHWATTAAARLLMHLARADRAAVAEMMCLDLPPLLAQCMRECQDNSAGGVAARALLGLVRELAGEHAGTLHASGLLSDVLRMLRFDCGGGVRGAALHALAALAAVRDRSVNEQIARSALLQLAEWLAPQQQHQQQQALQQQGAPQAAGASSDDDSGPAAAAAAAATIDALLETGSVDLAAVLPLVEGGGEGEGDVPTSAASTPRSGAGSASAGSSSSKQPSGRGGAGGARCDPSSAAVQLMAHCMACLPVASPDAALPSPPPARGQPAAKAVAKGAGVAAPAVPPLSPCMVAAQLANTLIPLLPAFSEACILVEGVARLVNIILTPGAPLALRAECLSMLDSLSLSHREEVVKSNVVPAVVAMLRSQVTGGGGSADSSGASSSVAARAAGGAATGAATPGDEGEAAARGRQMTATGARRRSGSGSRRVGGGGGSGSGSGVRTNRSALSEDALVMEAKVTACNLITVLAFNDGVKRQLFLGDAVGPLMQLAEATHAPQGQAAPGQAAVRAALSQLGLIYLLAQ